MSFITTDNSVANRFPYPAILKEMAVFTDCLEELPSPFPPAPFEFSGPYRARVTGAADLDNIPGEQGHPGIFKATVAGAGDSARLNLLRDTLITQPVPHINPVRIGAVIRPIALGGALATFGLGTEINVGAGTRVQIAANGATGLWECSAGDGINPVQVFQGPGIGFGRWIRLEIVGLGNTNQFYIGGVLVATATIGSLSATTFGAVSTGDAAEVDVDLVYTIEGGLDR